MKTYILSTDIQESFEREAGFALPRDAFNGKTVDEVKSVLREYDVNGDIFVYSTQNGRTIVEKHTLETSRIADDEYTGSTSHIMESDTIDSQRDIEFYDGSIPTRRRQSEFTEGHTEEMEELLKKSENLRRLERKYRTSDKIKETFKEVAGFELDDKVFDGTRSIHDVMDVLNIAYGIHGCVTMYYVCGDRIVSSETLVSGFGVPEKIDTTYRGEINNGHILLERDIESETKRKKLDKKNDIEYYNEGNHTATVKALEDAA